MPPFFSEHLVFATAMLAQVNLGQNGGVKGDKKLGSD
jgi:hypothetical protein